MTEVLNGPSQWPLINFIVVSSYFVVAASTIVVYDWALAFGQEFELVWRQRWSLMTVLYLGLRFAGTLYFVISILSTLPSISVTDTGCTILAFSQTWISFVVNTILDVIIVVRLHAMYQQSRKMLIFLVAILLLITIPCGVITAVLQLSHFSWEEFVLSGTYQCIGTNTGNDRLLIAATWILGTIWELLALFLAVWITIKRSRELRRWNIEDRFSALMKTQVLYFAAFAATTCLNLGSILSTNISGSTSVGAEIYLGILAILQFVQLFVLGPRLVLSVREYHAKLVANPDAGTSMQMLSRSAYTSSQLEVCGTGNNQHVLGR